MSELSSTPAAGPTLTKVADAAATTRRPSPVAQPRMGAARWWREVGWRHVVGVAMLVFSLFPVLYIISAAFNPLGSVVSTGIIPRAFSLENFDKLFSTTSFERWLLNSLLVATVVTVFQVFCSSLAAYAFSRLRFRGRRGGLLTLLLIQMFPQFLALVAIYQMFTTIGDVVPSIGLNTIAGYMLVLSAGALGQVWLIKGFFDAVPKDLDEAATVDGAGHVTIFFRILLPLLRPILVVTGLLAFIGVINDFLMASIFLRDDSAKTVVIGLYGIIDADRSNNLGLFAAGALITAVPVVVLFQVAQRYIVGGITVGAVKG
ncbi:sugar ABC transporter permease [Kineosporia sp. R_H_3]|uniref:sugar ABC transporter permease n=1 Tax=Kineosporia sp. R_H_3 TaxID=1961848 RepID=UPI000B4C0C98|nr:ABC transporter permease subunit [Kineosporia sp. R_H_3]